MKNKIHYYLRFVLAYTHEEIKGIVVLFLLMGIYVLCYIGNEYYSKEQERLEFNPVVWEANYKLISPKSGGRESEGVYFVCRRGDCAGGWHGLGLVFSDQQGFVDEFLCAGCGGLGSFIARRFAGDDSF